MMKLRQLPLKGLVEVYHHIFKFRKERTFSYQMLDELQNLDDQLVYFIIVLQADRSGSIPVFVEQKKLLSSHQVDP